MISTHHYLWAELLSLSHDTSNSTHAFRISQIFFVLFGVEHLSSENLPLSFPSQSINFALTIFQAANQPTQHVAKALALRTEFKPTDARPKNGEGGEFIS